MTCSTQPEETTFRVSRRWERLAWLPILLLMVLIAGFWVADLRTEYEWPGLQIALNFVTRTLVCLYIAFLTGRSFWRAASGACCWGAVWRSEGPQDGQGGTLIRHLTDISANLSIMVIPNAGLKFQPPVFLTCCR